MAKWLGLDDRIALLKHYEIDVAEGHVRNGTPITIVGTSERENQRVVTATIGTASAQRFCPVTAFLAEGLIDELANPHLREKPQLRRAVAHLVEKLSKMYVDSMLDGFSITATIEGDHYEVLPKTASIEASHNTTIPHRLTPHAHDRGGPPLRTTQG